MVIKLPGGSFFLLTENGRKDSYYIYYLYYKVVQAVYGEFMLY